MKALCWHGVGDVRYDEVEDPKIEQPGDVLLRVTRTAICGSDLHLYSGYMPAMQAGDVLGHEFMGEVVETGAEVEKLRNGDRVVVPFNISCGHCFFCEQELFSLCDESNPDADKVKPIYGQSPNGMFGYSHLFGGYAGGQAEYVRVPYADVGPMKAPSSLDDEQVLFLTDIFPTGYQAVSDAHPRPGDTIAIWGCGPVGLFAQLSAQLLGAGRVIGIDRVSERLAMARGIGSEVIDEGAEDVFERLMQMTGGRGPDIAIDAVGTEAHGLDMTGQQTDKAHVLRQAVLCVRKGGTVSVPGVYGGMVEFPMGAAHAKSLHIRMGQTHTRKHMPKLLDLIERGDLDPTFLITHRLSLSDGPEAYRKFRDKRDNCIKVVMTP